MVQYRTLVGILPTIWYSTVPSHIKYGHAFWHTRLVGSDFEYWFEKCGGGRVRFTITVVHVS